MHLVVTCTTRDLCAYIIYIANIVEPAGRFRIHNRAPVKKSDVFLVFNLP